MNSDDIFVTIRKMQEGYCVRHNIPVERQFSDREIGPVVAELEQIETEIYGKQEEA